MTNKQYAEYIMDKMFNDSTFHTETKKIIEAAKPDKNSIITPALLIDPITLGPRELNIINGIYCIKQKDNLLNTPSVNNLISAIVKLESHERSTITL